MNTNETSSNNNLIEALELSEEILKNIELNELPLTNIALKTSRLSRLLNDFDAQKIFEYEISGYPTLPSGFAPEIWKLIVSSGRNYSDTDTSSDEIKEFGYLDSIATLEETKRIGEIAISSASDPDISISSANPKQYVSAPRSSNQIERLAIRKSIKDASARLASRQGYIYQYVLQKHYELKYSGIADDIFTRVRKNVDKSIGEIIPDAVKKLTAVYENLKSDNPENWSNAVHSCRRILQDLADNLYPPTEDQKKIIGGKEKVIKMGKENYINRLIAYIEDNSDSSRYQEIVGSHLRFVGDRLDSIFRAAQKGSHSIIISREEADRYVIYTFLVVGDILSIKQ